MGAAGHPQLFSGPRWTAGAHPTPQGLPVLTGVRPALWLSNFGCCLRGSPLPHCLANLRGLDGQGWLLLPVAVAGMLCAFLPFFPFSYRCNLRPHTCEPDRTLSCRLRPFSSALRQELAKSPRLACKSAIFLPQPPESLASQACASKPWPRSLIFFSYTLSPQVLPSPVLPTIPPSCAWPGLGPTPSAGKPGGTQDSFQCPHRETHFISSQHYLAY